jgi:drug/metabolite transporter (DMT)-like permease
VNDQPPAKAALVQRFAALPGPARAAFWMSASALLYAVSQTIVRDISDAVPTFQIVFLRNLFGLAFMIPWLLHVGIGVLRTRQLGMHVVRGFASAMNLWCGFGAVAYIPVADSAAIGFLQPIFVGIAAVLILGEVAGVRRWLAIVAGFIGALIVVRPGFAELNTGVILAFGAAVAGAAVAILVKTLLRTDPPDTVAAFLFMVQTVLSLVPAILVWKPLTLELWAWLVFLGFLGMLIQRCFNRAMAAADASIAVPFNFTRLIWAALLGYFVFAEVPNIWTWIGGSVIFAASVALTRKGA